MSKQVLLMKEPPMHFSHLGLVMPRGEVGSYDSSVTGDPCIVWDQVNGSYRMFYFAQRHENGMEINCCAHAISDSPSSLATGIWKKKGPLKYINEEQLEKGSSKPWILCDPYRPGIPVKINGMYLLFFVVHSHANKIIRCAKAEKLTGPWHIQAQPVLETGFPNCFDGYHVDTVSAYWFESKQKILLFYKGYPMMPQRDQPYSPYGSSTAVAILEPHAQTAQKIGRIIAPSPSRLHWLFGWTSGIQLFPAQRGGWYGLMTGSPTPPIPVTEEPNMREPSPSLGGWAYTPQLFPINGWRAFEKPITTLEDIPKKAQENGEVVNLWRHHLLVDQQGDMYLYYNAGSYGQEQMFCRKACVEKI